MANEVGHGKVFGQLDNQGWLLTPGAEPQEVAYGTKQVVAAQILAAVDRVMDAAI